MASIPKNFEQVVAELCAAAVQPARALPGWSPLARDVVVGPVSLRLAYIDCLD